MKICSDGRIWGQTNKEAGTHLGILTRGSGSKRIKKGRLKIHWWRNGKEFQKGHVPWDKGIKRIEIAGDKHPCWKGGISRTPAWFKERRRLYKNKYPEKVRLLGKICKARRKNAGILTIKTVQLVYEDNIKKYGTLTCIYCLQPISFGQDTLEHKQPISRGGLNEKFNLDIACRKCNLRKNNKTEEEFRRKEDSNGRRPC